VGVDFVTPSPIGIEEGLEFILSHFQEPYWPRTISTFTTGGRQVLIFNKQEALARFKQANYLDCRINAYPNYVGFIGINRQSPNFILIDIDKANFKTDKAFRTAVRKTIQNLQVVLEANPTILWTMASIFINP
jgi:hypothetical protein